MVWMKGGWGAGARRSLSGPIVKGHLAVQRQGAGRQACAAPTPPTADCDLTLGAVARWFQAVLGHHSARSAPSFLNSPVAEHNSFSWPPRL